MKPILYSLGGAVGLVVALAAYEVACILAAKRSNDLYRESLIEDDGFITVHPELRA